MSQPVPDTGLVHICPVCLQTFGGIPARATVVTPNGYACCATHAPIVAENGLEDAVILVRRSLGIR